MALAQEIHESLVPPIDLRTPACEVLGDSQPSSEMGGDLLDFRHDGEALTLIVADVSGHGVAAGVMMAMLKSALHSAMRRAADLGALARDANSVLHGLVASGKFATFAALCVRPGREVEYALAGHLPIYWFRADVAALEELPNEHLPLAVMEESDCTSRIIRVGKGDLLVLLTDGFTETANAAGELFGEERIRRILRDAADRPLPEVRAQLVRECAAFGPREDDQTVLLVRIV
jgi:sigma-B regulation protein RsbU (phosphoserine phosphatase)